MNRMYCLWPLLVITFGLLVACDEDRQAPHAVTELEVWMHGGSAARLQTLQGQVARFNASQRRQRINVVVLPAGNYHAQVNAALADGRLPDILEVDAALFSRAISGERLLRLDKQLTEGTQVDLLPEVMQQGMSQGHLYQVASDDAVIAMYVRRSQLQAAGVMIPAAGQGWSAAEFSRVLARLAEHDADHAVLDLQLNRSDDWISSLLMPLLQSAGVDINADALADHSRGALNDEGAVRVLTQLQHWLRQGSVDGNGDDLAFVNGRVAVSIADQSHYLRYRAAAADDLLVLPLPDFGHGIRSVHDNWGWALSTRCKDPRAAIRFIEFLLQPAEMLRITDSSGTLPVTRSAVSSSQLMASDPNLQRLQRLAQSTVIDWRRGAQYPQLALALRQAFAAARRGQDVRTTLDDMVARVTAGH
ncbi:MAG: extracellular solute-binding protein [Gammaproteobacteria bacterium]|nr:extracellular solute-binding protein [Gammaproteobacteria bacterium]